MELTSWRILNGFVGAANEPPGESGESPDIPGRFSGGITWQPGWRNYVDRSGLDAVQQNEARTLQEIVKVGGIVVRSAGHLGHVHRKVPETRLGES
jgi:hypothetical protein